MNLWHRTASSPMLLAMIASSYCNWNRSRTCDPIFTPRVLEPSKEIIVNERVAVTQSHLLKCQGCLRFFILGSTQHIAETTPAHVPLHYKPSLCDSSNESFCNYIGSTLNLFTLHAFDPPLACQRSYMPFATISQAVFVEIIDHIHMLIPPHQSIWDGSLCFGSNGKPPFHFKPWPKNSFCGLGWLVSAAPTLSWNQPKSKMSLFARGWGCLLRIGRCADRLQVLHDAPVARSPQARSIPEGLGLRRARLVIEDLDGIHIFILAADVLVHHQRRQARPHNSSDEGAQLDHIAEGLRILLRDCDELVAQDS